MKRNWAIGLGLVVGFAFHQASQALTINVVDPNGTAVSGFRWLLEKDNTHPVKPGEHVIAGPVVSGSDPEAALGPAGAKNNLAISIHRSHAPVIVSGETALSQASITTLADGVTPLPTDQNYMVSVLPGGPFTMGGTNIQPGQTDATIIVTPQPIKTAQISVKVFHDNAPVNNVLDVTELGLEDFKVQVSDNAGLMFEDIFGNPVGSTYVKDVCGAGFVVNPDGFCLDPDGAPEISVIGEGFLRSDANGVALIKNLAPGKYGVTVTPPAGQGWFQTTTIEGTRTIDTWVRPDEPPLQVEFGTPFFHTFYGFVQAQDNLPATASPKTISGQVRKLHTARPSTTGGDDDAGPPPSTSPCIVALNPTTPNEQVFHVSKCADDGLFSIAGVGPGLYQLVIWDQFLDHIISFQSVTVDSAGGTLDLGLVTTPMWFGEQEHYVFFDANEDGFRDPGEIGMPEQNVNLRFRDGSIYKAFPTDLDGFVPFEEVFPFLHHLVMEVDFARFKATGVTNVNDNGGDIPATSFAEGKRNPVIDITTGLPYRTETGPVLTQMFQTFATQNQRIEWGKSNYAAGENGGISGVIFYATTRAEDDPRFAAGEEWEPGIPRIQVALYEDSNDDGIPDDQPGTPPPAADGDDSPDFNKADVDNHPLGWSDGGTKGPEDTDWDLDGTFDMGDAIRVTWTDSWDDNLPTGCDATAGTFDELVLHGVTIPLSECADGLRTWNQIRPGVFDGGYAFGPGELGNVEDPVVPPGVYIVEAALPPGYQLVKEEDRNVDFGLSYVPSPLLLPPTCIGNPHVVPAKLSLFPSVDAPFAGETRTLCDRKRVMLSEGQNAAADFFLFTDVPKAARAVGLITDDFAIEGDPNVPSFQEKFSPGWISVAVFDYSGKEIIRTYGDEYGVYNFLAPSTFSIDVASPTGVGPAMHQLCLNHPGPIEDSASPGTFITDPNYKAQYSTTCYKFDFWPGKTTYVDTPIIRQAAFIGPLQASLDCECEDGTPLISQVLNNGNGYPAYVDSTNSSITIMSLGSTQVPNPDFPDADPPTVPEFIPRDYGFGGTQGVVTVTTSTGVVQTIPAGNVTWSDGAITVNPIPVGLQSGQLTVTKADGTPSKMGVTLTVGPVPATTMVHVVSPGDSIQAAVNAADDDDLILVNPGTYRELVIINKEVQLQGAGAPSTVIDALPFPAEIVDTYLANLQSLRDLGLVGEVGGPTGGQVGIDPSFLGFNGPGILVMPPATGALAFDQSIPARIDGFTIQGANAGGIIVNAYAPGLNIGNNRLTSNNGDMGGGIRVGSPRTLQLAFTEGTAPVIEIDDSPNPNLRIHHNHITTNGSFQYGGGIAMYNGADDYSIDSNTICGNFSQLNGAGVAHVGVSNNGTIANNSIVLNEQFQGDQVLFSIGGGGIGLAGEAPEPSTTSTVSRGTGNVTIDGNLIQANLAGAGDGGGISMLLVNGRDVEDNPGTPANWHKVDIFNNMIVNNVGAVAGGGIGLQDVLRANIVHNTIVNNDSTATGALAFGNVGFDDDGIPPALPPTQSNWHPAGIVSRGHSLSLTAVLSGLGEEAFSDPTLVSNIIWHNRSFRYDIAVGGNNLAPLPGGMPAEGPFWDIGVIGAGPLASLDPSFSILSNLTDASGTVYNNINNKTDDPIFVSEYLLTLVTAAETAEGGNFVQMLFTPLSLFDTVTGDPLGDYHIDTTPPITSPVIAMANPVLSSALLAMDFDDDSRPNPITAAAPDIGADEIEDPISDVDDPDSDGDGIPDAQDNCRDVANADQRNTNAPDDQVGNICDPDLNNDNIVDFADLSILKPAFFSQAGDANFNPDADLNGDGVVDFGDLPLVQLYFFGEPGPTGIKP